MRLLELFAGSKSVSKAVGHLFDETVSIDIVKESNPTICIDILLWDYKVYSRDYFHSIWASPPCTEYSHLKYAQPNSPRNLELADSLVKKSIEIIEYFKPEIWFIENPKTGLLKTRPFMTRFNFYDVDYCAYSDWGYKKQTRIWTNKTGFTAKKCLGTGKCPNMTGKQHKYSTGNSYLKTKATVKNRSTLYRIPEKLIIDLFGIF
jgi:site-specific DNA-cytosine methylase